MLERLNVFVPSCNEISMVSSKMNMINGFCTKNDMKVSSFEQSKTCVECTFGIFAYSKHLTILAKYFH